MKKILMGCLGVMAVVLAAQFARAEVCDVACNPCDMACGKQSLWYWGGHLEAGIFANDHGRKNIYSFGQLQSYGGNLRIMQNVRQSDFQMNQLYYKFGKKLDTRRRAIDFGGHIDFMYGTDAALVQSRGLEYGAGHGTWKSGDYYTAIPQMYFEVGRKNVSLKVGKFLSDMSHDSVLSNDRFFYSLSDSYGLTPNTLSGIVGTWKISNRLSAFGGWVQGDRWYADDLYKESFFFDTSDNNAFYGGFDWNYKRLNLKYVVFAGKDNALDHDKREFWVQSFIVDYKLGKKWDYTFEWTLRNDNYENRYNSDVKEHIGAYAINQELVYRLNKKWAFGARVEWVHTYDSDVNDERLDQDKFGFSLGAQWTPTKRILVRPELRYDKFEHDYVYSRNERGDFSKNQLSGGISTVVTF